MSHNEPDLEPRTGPVDDEVDAETRVRRRGSPEVECVEVGGESVVYDATHDSLHVLDRTGTLIWARLEGETTVDGISAELSEAFGVEAAVVRTDVLAFVRELEVLQLLERVS